METSQQQQKLETFNNDTPGQDTREQLDGELWLVDYDLDVCNGRREFYRQINRFRRKYKIPANRSSDSVLVTRDRYYAEFVYEQACLHGTAHLYQATKIR